MHPAIRNQGSLRRTKKDKFTDSTSIVCAGTDRTRQEFKEEADINTLLKRYGIGVPQKQVHYGDWDETILDLQTAYEADARAHDFYKHLPKQIKDKYPNWQAVVLAVQNGEITQDTLAAMKKKPDTPKPEETPQPQS